MSELALVVDAYPRSEHLKFTISIICGTALVRLDYWELDRHLNHMVSGLVTPAGVQLGWLEGSHYHGWEQNRGLVRNEPPKDSNSQFLCLRTCEDLQDLRWFCAENGIDLGSQQPPELPAKDVLL